MKLKAIQAFSSGYEGSISFEQEFTASKERAEYLIKNGYAVAVQEVEPVKPVKK